QPPFLGRELHDVLVALGVDDVTAQAALGDEDRMGGDIPAALNELARPKHLRQEERPHEREILVSECRPALEISPESLKRHALSLTLLSTADNDIPATRLAGQNVHGRSAFGDQPSSIRASIVVECRRARVPSAVSLKHFRARPPGTGSGSDSVNETRPLSCSRPSVA